MMKARYSKLDSVYIKNLHFDGNSGKYSLNYDWRVNQTILLPTTNSSIIEDCRFYRIPNENVILCGTIFKNCSGNYLNGSISHFSCNSFDRKTEVTYNTFSHTNIIGDSVMEHSEAPFTFSSKVQNLKLAYNTINDIGESGIGQFQNDDLSNTITDNLLESETPTIRYSPFYNHYDTNKIYNNKNTKNTDKSNGTCWINVPKLNYTSPCQANSSTDQPLNLGDTISITIDSIQLRKSNENFVKFIVPIYNNEYFTLTGMHIESPNLTSYHSWEFKQISDSMYGLVFNNGHQNGIFNKGNWGNELCNKTGGCNNVKFIFTVTEVPNSTGEVTCPFQGFKIVYDGDMGSWDHPIYCQNIPMYYETSILGKPVLSGDLNTSILPISKSNKIAILPNPSRTYISIDYPETSEYNYVIINNTGSIVRTAKSKGYKVPINKLQAGLYFLKVNIDNKYFIGKFVKAN